MGLQNLNRSHLGASQKDASYPLTRLVLSSGYWDHVKETATELHLSDHTVRLKQTTNTSRIVL